ncbi:AraC family transcriptional regulator [Rhodanobacter sp. Col0626]|uniref:AraC family transcriptional regulator n=1 Tax=Rhodanobacter sp. Col0626 TaxID=3415679 RepID=UPI003CEA1118
MPLTKKALHELADSNEGPALIAHWSAGEATSEYSEGTRIYEWHSHQRGQFYCIESGLVHVHTTHGSWMLPPYRGSWMPPGEMHRVSISGPMTGWGVFIAPRASHCLPDHPCVIGVSELMRALVRHASAWSWETQLNEEQERILAVLLDEMRRAPRESLYLPMPSDRRLLRIAQAVLEQPQDNRNLEDWAAWAGLSARSLSRLFRAETALSFAQWRQQARLSRALEQLAEGEPVATVADAMGYASVSAFVAMFRRSFGQSPGRYFTPQSMPA